MREDLDKAGQHLRPGVENPSSSWAARELPVTRDKIVNNSDIRAFNQSLDIDRRSIATLFGKIHPLIKHIGHTSAHAGGEILTACSEDDYQTFSHVFAAVIADALDDGGGSGIAYSKTLARDAVEKGFPAGRA